MLDAPPAIPSKALEPPMHTDEPSHGTIVGNSPDRNLRSWWPNKNRRDPRGFLRLAMERIYMAVHDGFAAHAGTG